MNGKEWHLWPWRWKVFTADPEKAVFARLFRRLLLWYGSLLAVLIALLTLSIGTSVPWLTFTSNEHNLSGPISQLAQAWQAAPDTGCPPAQSAQGYMFACYNAQGQLVRSTGIKTQPEKHFLENSLALEALDNRSSAQDALNGTGTEEVQFALVFVTTSATPGMVRQAQTVLRPGSNQVLGVVQLGTTPGETLADRSVIVRIFLASMAIVLILGVPTGGWYLASQALRPARLAFQRQRDFIANVSHELGTPLALLRANAEVLLRNRSRLAEEDAALLEDIVAETAYMDKMTGNMLLLARMDTGQFRPERTMLDLGQIAEGCVRRAQALANQAGITLTFQPEETTHMRGDRTLLEQATLILLDNALKYTQPDGKVSVYTFIEHGHACLKVSDTGIGIAPADLPHLGQRFYRVDKARSREVGGNGLGLSIAYGIVAAHKGKLTLTSEPGKGTSATLLLPVAR